MIDKSALGNDSYKQSDTLGAIKPFYMRSTNPTGSAISFLLLMYESIALVLD
jgi:hypothetical protein